MPENSILDQPIQPPQKSQRLFHKIVRFIEVGLWLTAIASVFVAFPSQIKASDEVVPNLGIALIAMVLLALVYLALPIFIFGSKGWKQHLVSHLCSLPLLFWFTGILFQIESWELVNEMRLLAAAGATAALSVAVFQLIKGKTNEQARSFWLHVTVRMAVVFVFNVAAVAQWIRQ